MFKLTIVGTIVAFAAAHNSSRFSSPINHDMVAQIREQNDWIAHDPETNPLRNYTREMLLNLVSGAFIGEPRFETESDTAASLTAPSEWDPRTGPNAKCIHPIRDQAQCGSCWAFGATEALSDRFCLKGTDVILSPQDLVSCDGNNYGCDGGYLSKAWDFLTKPGAVADSCWPYASASGVAPPC